MNNKKAPVLKTPIIQEIQTLPQQEKFFATGSLRRSARAGTQLPDPKIEPFGYDPRAQFRHLFPELNLPPLFPPARVHPEDAVSFGHSQMPPHQLYMGDNLYVLRNLPSESVDLIYIDPPFFSNRNYTQIWGDDNEVRSFGDIFQDGMYSYLAWLNARLWEMKRVLKKTGSIYVHCDWHASHYIKCEMDKIFGYDNFKDEIVWYYQSGGGRSKDYFNRKHDILLWYVKTDNYKYNIDKIRVSYKETSMYSKYGTTSLAGKEYKPDLNQGKNPDDVWEMNILNPTAHERIGYPTQKPLEILQRIIDAHSDPGDTVADFFMGGGSFGAVALGLRTIIGAPLSGTQYEYDKPRLFIGCDISRVAVSVTASRLIDIGEEMSGITVSKKAQKTLGVESKPVADIRIGYVGNYPIEKFKGMAHEEFVKFILELYTASAFTGKAKFIHGLANNKLIISVGPSNPDHRVSVKQVQVVVEETLRQYQSQLAAGEDKIIQIVGWAFDPSIEMWKGQAISVLNKQNIKLSIELVALGSESFRQRIFRLVGESNLDLKFNRLNDLLSFAGTPFAGTIAVIKQDGLNLEFTLQGARALGTGHLINCQWDFNFDGQRFSSREHALNREGSSGKFKAVLDIEYEFPKSGEYTIAARVQDNLDGEHTVVAKLELNEKAYKIKEVVSFYFEPQLK